MKSVSPPNTCQCLPEYGAANELGAHGPIHTPSHADRPVRSPHERHSR